MAQISWSSQMKTRAYCASPGDEDGFFFFDDLLELFLSAFKGNTVKSAVASADMDAA